MGYELGGWHVNILKHKAARSSRFEASIRVRGVMHVAY
jgi:hypothetical protein